MNKNISRHLIYSLLLTFISAPDVLAEDIKKSVVQIFTQSKVPDYYFYPWQMGRMESSSGSGVIIDGDRILTAAHVVDNAVTIYVRKIGSDEHLAAKVSFISDESDLAIVTVEDKSFFKNTAPLKLGVLPQLGDGIVAWGFPMGGNQLAITQGIVSRIDFDRYAHSDYANLVVQIDAAINVGASGGPAITDGKIVGINFQGITGADNVGYIIPTPVIQQFLTDIKDNKVDGVPNVALYSSSMDNPQLRKYYQLDKNQSGMLIFGLSGMEKEIGLFKEGDVLLSIDGQKIGNDGTVAFDGNDRISKNYLITRHQISDTIDISVLRDGKIVNFLYTLGYTCQQSSLITHHYSGFHPDYIVIGGLVFQELSRDYFKFFGEKGVSDAPGWMQEIYVEHKRLGLGQHERVVFVSAVLPDEINHDYDSNVGESVIAINDQPVNSIDDMRAVLAKNEAAIRITFGPWGSEIVFDRKQLEIREPIIRKNFGLDAPSVLENE